MMAIYIQIAFENVFNARYGKVHNRFTAQQETLQSPIYQSRAPPPHVPETYMHACALCDVPGAAAGIGCNFCECILLA